MAAVSPPDLKSCDQLFVPDLPANRKLAMHGQGEVPLSLAYAPRSAAINIVSAVPVRGLVAG